MTDKPCNVSNRNYLKPFEVNTLILAASNTRHPTRDKLIIYLLYRHGLRVSELINLTLHDIDLKSGLIHVNRLKGSKDSIQPLQAVTIRLLNKYLKERNSDSNYLLLSNRKQPLHRFTVTKLIMRLSDKANLPIKATAHTLRHSCGYALINKGVPLEVVQDYLGHVKIDNTRIYTKLNSKRFNKLW